eukprot:TRINITY_DN4509_c0_g1_i1.p1 TRINITY_DN4509_c0_g1~~TRINITY_DN4509_c0_g1_i1.p1  ORF type:complete len:347 (+),score=64.81 TRINITY_DN4509_c0_g1_i1:75-1043(+)
MSRAIVMTETGGPEVLKLRDVAMPVPGKTQVRIEVHAVGVNPVETYWRSGTAGRNPKLPYTPGRDAAGKVHCVGSDVKGLKVGDRVFTTGAATGTYSHHCLADQNDVHLLPDDVSYDAGASLGTPALAAYRAVFTRGQAKSGEKILIHGASGGVGLIAIQLAKTHGMYVVGTADNQRGVDLIKSVGCDEGFIHNEKGYFEKVKKAGPYNLIVEVIANINLANDLSAAAKNGRVVIVGSRGEVKINPRDIMVKELDVRGLFLTTQTLEEKREAVAKLTAGLSQKTLKPVVSEVLNLDEAARAHIRVIQREEGIIGKIIMRPKL